MRFEDRRQAGRALGERLRDLFAAQQIADPVVLALPRGGVVVAAEVAAALAAPLEILTVLKIGAPGQPELGIGAIAGEDPPLLDRPSLDYFAMTEDDLVGRVERARAEIRRRELRYRGGRPEPDVRGRTVILVDDGLATGVTARAASDWVRRREPARLILAAPVCSREAASRSREEVDDVVCLMELSEFYGVSLWYEDFEQVSDDEVDDIMARAAGGPGRSDT